MRRLLFWATLASGVAAAYLMFRRGESLSVIAQETTHNPVKTLAHELQAAI